ncbi:Stk1 family PASTA domain-containing Ser/Thr kinase [Nocardioides sp. GCM10027113]|uniref:Stk1 family PASTA domain-containing Ser/Thr kinase n=1 Tax=unclassified Nocardioides TaxID=2615069 RepID=UPI003619B2B0
MQPDRHARAGESAGLSDPMTGRVLDGRYQVGPRVARGGMASVYEATDLRLQRTVAVKVMHPGLGDPVLGDDEFAARFVREARAAAGLSHPNIVAVYDQGDDDGTVFLAMEYVPGHTLRDVIRKEAPLAPARAVALLEPVLSALALAHRHGLVHRDIKPENVLIATDPSSGATRVKVADFGLAKAVSADTQHTATGGVLIGTVSYLAPELVVQSRSDARADVYAVGVVLFELLTGSKPHEGESPIQVAYKHVHEDVPAPSTLAPGIPGYVDALVARATARDTAQRPADAGVLLHQLHRVAQALAAGVVEDEDLEADLAPRRPVPSDDPEDTRADPFDTDELATVVAPAAAAAAVGGAHGTAAADHEPTTTLGRAEPAPLPDETGTRTVAAPVARPRRPRRSKRGPIMLVLALLLATAAGAGAWWFGWARYTATPAVLGLGKVAAVEKLEEAGLVAELGERQYSETVPAGKVLATDPATGERVLDGGTVTVVLSLGKERYDVPKLRGLSEDEAQDALQETNLAFGESTGAWSEKVPEGQVIASEPAAGTTLRPGAIVDLVVSKGPKPIRVRDWTGKDGDRAEQALTGSGLDVTRDTAYSDSVPEGDVISQDPSGGTTLYRGDDVRLVVSLGPELVEVPSGLRGSGVDAARQRLEDLGFDVKVERSDNYFGLGYVFSHSPKAGEMVPRGSTITLYLI